jgi:hypothetical protein
MRLWAVCGFEQMYGGLHGMIETAIIEGTEDEAHEYAIELSESVINSYSEIADELEETIKEDCEFNNINYYEDEDEVWSIREQVYDDDIDYEYVELDVNKLPTLNIEKLEEMLYDDKDSFIDAYRLD